MRKHFDIVKCCGMSTVRDGLVPGHHALDRLRAARDSGVQGIWDFYTIIGISILSIEAFDIILTQLNILIQAQASPLSIAFLVGLAIALWSANGI
jgi:hypothetical protein